MQSIIDLMDLIATGPSTPLPMRRRAAFLRDELRRWQFVDYLFRPVRVQ